MKFTKYYLASVLIICFALLLSGEPQETEKEIRGKIMGKNSALCKIINSGNKGALADFINTTYCRPDTKTVILLRRNYENKVASKHELIKFWEGLMDRGVTGLVFKTKKLDVFGDFAIEYGTLSYTIRSPSGEDLDPACEYQQGWCHREDCEWFYEFGNNPCDF